MIPGASDPLNRYQNQGAAKSFRKLRQSHFWPAEITPMFDRVGATFRPAGSTSHRARIEIAARPADHRVHARCQLAVTRVAPDHAVHSGDPEPLVRGGRSAAIEDPVRRPHHVALPVRAPAVDVGEAIFVGQGPARVDPAVLCVDVGVGGERRDGAPDEHGVSDSSKPITFSAASRQLASVTPKCSSIASERRKPGVTATAVTPVPASSSPMSNASRIAPILARS